MMSSEVETFVDISNPKQSQRFLDFARNDMREDLTSYLFSSLHIYHDISPHRAAMNMAIDEALLEDATVPSIRFYRWYFPALSFGYFRRFGDVASYGTERDLIRRWTGGGIVFHGEDLTYSIVIPASNAAFSESSILIYEKIHRVLCDVLIANGERAELAFAAGVGDAGTAIIDRGHSCFANPVRADVMIDGRKIAGAAQRRTRRGLLQQGSIQGVKLENRLAERFARGLSANCIEREVDRNILNRARELAQCKYGTDAWLRKR
jgi:lipoate-protein ligase A